MGTEATQPPSAGPSAATAYPRWVLLDRYYKGEDAGSSTTTDAMTLVTARTSRGRHIGVSLRLAAPPAVSSVCLHFPHGATNTLGLVVAAHGDSVILYISFKEEEEGSFLGLDETDDYFVYNAGAATAEPPRPPTLSLLRPYYLTKQKLKNSCSYGRGLVQCYLCRESTGLLRRGDDEIAVAELKLVEPTTTDGTRTATQTPKEAELLLLLSNQWSVTRLPIRTSHGDAKNAEELLSSWRTCTVLPVGDSLLCWVDLFDGLLLCNVFDESPVLQHVPLPVEAARTLSGPGPSRNVCVTAGGAVKFVDAVPRCCCGGVGSTHCQTSRHAYTISTWSLRMDDMLWALDAYKGIPRMPLRCPIVSMDDGDPHVIWFLVCRTGFLILVDTRRKDILSVYRQSDGLSRDSLLPSRVSYYFDSNPSSGKGESSVTKGPMDMIPSPVVGDSAEASRTEFVEPGLQLSAILAVFQEMASYGLDRDDMLKACSILRQNDGRRFRSLLRVPKNLRKDWLLMEINATPRVDP
ncbi:hypothetical protein BS78_K012100 [Paspalum vaginatum]|uniref:DUF1618 domain-containing protein n=1 Tax=Paspalum vaginatum TaxID=158149 RepID=A0A9W7XCM4_9POAL|nr:hypothetical protein BS78_K012100 [Paspalum vaginatum]